MGQAAVDLPLGSWRRTLIAAALLVGAVAALLGVALTRGDLRYTSFPGHPYPPPGFYQNPFSNDPGDLIDAAEAARVKSDFLQDGQIELDAFARGDASLLHQSDTGNSLARLRQLIDLDTAAGVVRRYDNHVESLVVGRLADPASPSVTWCVREEGWSTLTTVVKASGQTVGKQRYRFESRFWLAKVDDRYLIADAEVSNRPMTEG